jgi:glucosamine--fructose-6-phosphate aminotransferase (isomerizing)
LYPRSSYPSRGKTLLVAVSRSGETTETLRACQAFLDAGRGTLVTLSCYGDMPLAKMGALNLVFPSGQERSVAQTRAFSTLDLAATAISAIWAGRQDLLKHLPALSAVEQRVLAASEEPARRYGEDLGIDRFYFLGSGPRYGLACELSLKMKEMSLSHSEPFHFMEFRHGPKSMVTANTLVVGLLSESNAAPEQAVLADMRALGGRILTIGESGTDVHFDSGLDEDLRGPLYLAPGQMLAFDRSIAKGLNPDRPHNLDTVVKL